MADVRKCPKCSGEMEQGRIPGADIFGFIKKGDSYLRPGDRLYAFYCRECGFIELCKEIGERRKTHE